MTKYINVPCPKAHQVHLWAECWSPRLPLSLALGADYPSDKDSTQVGDQNALLHYRTDCSHACCFATLDQFC